MRFAWSSRWLFDPTPRDLRGRARGATNLRGGDAGRRRAERPRNRAAL